MLKTVMYNDKKFVSDDLYRYEDIEKNPVTENEKFLCEMIEKFYMRIADLQDEIKDLKYQLECADLGNNV